MDFSISRDELYKALSRSQGVVSAKGAMPILGNLLLEATEEGLTVFATNLDIGIKGFCAAQVAQTGKTTTQAKSFHDIVRELPAGDIQIKTDDDGRLRISSGKSKFNLATMPADEFPALPDYDQENMIEVESAMVGEMIKKTSYAISQDETRLTLSGANFEATASRFCMVATDGHRLAYVDREGDFPVKEDVKAIITRKAVVELSKLIGDGTGNLSFAKEDNHIMFKVGSVTMVVRLIEGAFPNYEQVIPKEHKSEATVKVADFANALRKVAILSDEKSKMVRLLFSGDRLVVSSEGGELGEGKDEINIEYEGEEITIGLNAIYLLDLLASIGDESVLIRLQESLSPLMALSPSDTGLKCIVMPMRL